jgi:hypothetical protein
MPEHHSQSLPVEGHVPGKALAGFFLLFSGTMGVGIWYFRSHLGGPGPLVALSYWLIFAILAGAIARGGRFYLAWFLAALVGSLILGAIGFQPWYLLLPMAAAVWLPPLRRARLQPVLILLAGFAAIALGCAYFFFINAAGYANIFLPERLLAGTAFPDSYFHTALSAMIADYGRLASALDGFAPLHYHAFSHLWFGVTARSMGLGAPHGYYLALQIIVLPLLLFSLCLATAAFGGKSRKGRETALLVSIPVALLFIIECFDWNSYLGSESEMVGLALLLTGLPFLRAMALDDGRHADREAILALTFAILLSASKISVGFLWSVAVVGVIARARLLSWKGYGVSAALTLLNVYLAVAVFAPNDNIVTTTIVPFDFLRNYPVVSAANFLPVLLAAALHFRDWQEGRDRRWQEAVLLLLLACLPPTLLLKADGGAVYYFINTGTWVAIASLAARLIALPVSGRRGALLAASVLVIIAAIPLTAAKRHALGLMKVQRNLVYARLDAVDPDKIRDANPFDPRALEILRARVAASPNARIGLTLQHLGVAAGSDTLVAVSPAFLAFWQTTPMCNVAPLLIPAYYGLPLLHGVPPAAEHCDEGAYYGYRFYGPGSRATLIGDAELCRQGRARGFHHIAVLEMPERGRRLDCPGT